MTENEFLEATARTNRDNLGFNGGWQRYSIRELISGDRKLGLFFIFLNDRLVKASLAYCPKDDTWDNWSEEKDAALKTEYQQALTEQLGEKNSFSWGRVNVVEDTKGGGTEIWIDYGES